MLAAGAVTRENLTRTDGMWGLGYKGTGEDVQWGRVGPVGSDQADGDRVGL